MKFLLDVCVASRSLKKLLVDLGNDVITGYDVGVKSLDEDLMHAAFESNRILVTADRDFGQLIFVRQLPHGAIIRFVNMDSSKWCAAMTKILDLHLSDLASGALITVSLGRIRVRR